MEKESQTRAQRIEQQLRVAGWLPGSQRLINVFLIRPTDEADGSGFADYALIDGQRSPIALVEAKRSSRSALEGERQAADYADQIAAKHGAEPYIFLAKGNEI